jgi:multidrug efflux pump subunit AcrA (membrane-fusion protein)
MPAAVASQPANVRVRTLRGIIKSWTATVRTFFLPALAVGAFSYTIWHVKRTSTVTPQTAPLVEPARTPYKSAVAGVGLVEPCTENIQVAAIVPGTVVEVAAAVGDRVDAGDILFRLDDRQRHSQLAVREAELAEAQATLQRWQHMPRAEDLPPIDARVRKSQADLALRQDQLRRTRELVAARALTEQDLVEREQSCRAAEAELAEAQAELARMKAGAWEADLAVARTQVAQAKSLVEQARTEVDRLVVRAPIRGTVLKVDVRPGEYVGTPPGKPLVVLGDTDTMHVRVDVDEQDLPRFHPGMPGQGFVRGDAEHPLPLRFVRVEPYAEPKRNLTGAGTERIPTRVLQVIYAIESAPRPVYVGQQLDVFLDRQSANPFHDATRAEAIASSEF